MSGVSAVADEVAVLSAAGSSYAVGPELRDMLALLDNGELHVVREARLDHAVMAYQQDLRRRGMTPTTVLTDIESIRALYARAPSPAGGITTAGTTHISHQQERVLKLIRVAMAHDASDLHFVIKQDIGVLRQRVHGMLEDVLKTSADDMIAVVACIYQSMCDVSSDSTFQPNKPQDARIKRAHLAAAGLLGARYSSYPSDEKLFVVLRLLYNRGSSVRTLTELGWNALQADAIRVMTRRKEGINIFSGATGSGKSTSLEVLLGMTVRHFESRFNLVTLEDPPEYRIPGAVQLPVIDGDWDLGLRSVMRLDPDIIMIGEIRDMISASAAFRAAMTGHGVWTTLHANDAIAIMQRLGDIGIEMALMLDPANVTGLINQSLVRRLCDHCKRPWLAERHLLDTDLVQRVEKWCRPESVSLVGPGCDRCNGKGITGRTIVGEVVVPTLSLMDTYRNDGKAATRRYWVQEMGGITKTAHTIEKISAGHVDPRHAEENVGPIDADFYAVRS